MNGSVLLHNHNNGLEAIISFLEIQASFSYINTYVSLNGENLILCICVHSFKAG